MQHWKIKLAGLLAALGSLAGLALSAAVPAGAAGASNVATHYSQFLAGHALQGNGSQAYNATWGAATVPNLTSAVTQDSVAVGVVLASSSVTSGPTYALALVWDDNVNTGSCGLAAWTLEANPAAYTPGGSAPEPVPTSVLKPLSEFGSPVCVAPAGTLWMKIQQSTRHHSISYIAGPSASDNDVVGTAPTSFGGTFLGAGEGVTATSGTIAATIPSGVLVSFSTFAVNRLAHHNGGRATGIAVGASGNGGSANWATYIGTELGTAPSVANPLTLTPSGFTLVGFGTKNSVSVP